MLGNHECECKCSLCSVRILIIFLPFIFQKLFLCFHLKLYIHMYLFVCLAVLGLNCGLWDLQSSFRHTESFSCGTWDFFSGGIWDLIPWPVIALEPPALGVQSLSHWTTKELLPMFVFSLLILLIFCFVFLFFTGKFFSFSSHSYLLVPCAFLLRNFRICLYS